MTKSCCAYNCTKRFQKGSGISFHRFPFARKELLKKWISSIRRENFVPNSHTFICSNHFTPDCFYENRVSRRILKEDAVPSIFDFPVHLKKELKSRKPPKVRNDGVLPLQSTSQNNINQRIQGTSSTDHTYFIQDSPRKLKRKYEMIIEEKDAEINELRKKLKMANMQVTRKNKKIASMSDVVKDLKEKKIVDSNLAQLLEKNFSDLSVEILKKQSKSKKDYSDQLKSFALSLFFYSAKAYDHVRRSFESLPSPSSLRRWYNVINGSPGFTGEALTALQKRVNDCNYEVHMALMFDEMSIRKHIEWNGAEFFGYISFGSNVCTERRSEAKEVLVFMVVGLNVPWSIPIAYFLTDKVTANEKASIVKQAILILHDMKVTTVSVTFDGTSVNLAAAEILGCKVHDHPLQIKPYFENPADKEKRVYIMPDACHMIKLMRNVFADFNLTYENKSISWKYIRELNDLQNSEGLHLSNKLRDSHVNFIQNKMKVSLAVQVFSNSVAKALLTLKNSPKFPQFKGCENTIDFISRFNSFFDLLNSKNCLAKGPKAAIKVSNRDYWEPFLKNMEDYLLKLKDSQSGKFLYQIQRKTPIIGFICLGRSVRGLFQDLVLSDKLKYITLYKMSQDHLEMFFSRVRQRGGWNNNPSAVQFRTAYKQLLVQNDIKASKNANVISQCETPLLSCLSVTPSVTESIFNNVTAERLFDLTGEKEINISSPEKNCNIIDVASDENASLLTLPQLSEYRNKIIVYIAGFVVKKLLKKIKCPECSNYLLHHNGILEHGDFLALRDFGGLKKPSHDVVAVCLFTEKCIREEVLINHGKMPYGNVKVRIMSKVLKSTIDKDYFSGLIPHSLESVFPDNHIHALIKAIADCFLNLRFHHLCKLTNISLKGKNIRQKCNKLVLFKNQ